MKLNFDFSRLLQAALQKPWGFVSFMLFQVGRDHCDWDFFIFIFLIGRIQEDSYILWKYGRGS